MKNYLQQIIAVTHKRYRAYVDTIRSSGKIYTFEIVMKNKGSNNPNAKLNDDEVFRIRELWSVGHRNTKVIARTFGISRANVMKIVKRKTWTHI